MKAVVLCSLFFVAVWALPRGENGLKDNRLYVDPKVTTPPKDLIPRIINGQEAVPHSIPYQAYLIVTSSKGSRWSCGGSLISPRHVLTAGHCVDDGISATVYLGTHNLQENEASRVVVSSRNLIRHADYNAADISNDIGLIVLDQAVELNDAVNVASLPSRESISSYEGANVRVSGWGLVSNNGTSSPVLVEVNTTVISNVVCNNIYHIVIDSQLCTSGEGGVGACSGDSGGPLVSGDDQIGIVSYSAMGCASGYPSGYTRVTSYLDWIEENTRLKF